MTRRQFFTYIGGSFEEDEGAPQPPASAIRLTQAELGARVLIVALRYAQQGKQLEREGIYVGAEVQLISRAREGSVIIETECKTVGLGEGIAKTIYVGVLY